jgi:hypothetical protein
MEYAFERVFLYDGKEKAGDPRRFVGGDCAL